MRPRRLSPFSQEIRPGVLYHTHGVVGKLGLDWIRSAESTSSTGCPIWTAMERRQETSEASMCSVTRDASVRDAKILSQQRMHVHFGRSLRVVRAPNPIFPVFRRPPRSGSNSRRIFSYSAIWPGPTDGLARRDHFHEMHHANTLRAARQGVPGGLVNEELDVGCQPVPSVIRASSSRSIVIVHGTTTQVDLEHRLASVVVRWTDKYDLAESALP